MTTKRCPVCGELYSDTYPRCPFCEEAERLKNGEQPRRHGGHRVAQNSSPSLLSPLLILAIMIMLGVLVYLLFGNTIASKLGLDEPEMPAASVSVEAPALSGSSAAGGSGSTSSSATASSSASTSTENGGAAASSSASTSKTETTTPQNQGPAPATSVSLNQKDFTLSSGETYEMKATGGNQDDYTWESEDDGVVSVDDKGTVTAVASGVATITVSDGYTTAECIVRVKGVSSTLTINKADVTLKVGESYTLKASGSSSVSWSSSNNSVVSVSGGKVKGVSSGTATVTAKAGGQSVSCIVRVK